MNAKPPTYDTPARISIRPGKLTVSTASHAVEVLITAEVAVDLGLAAFEVARLMLDEGKSPAIIETAPPALITREMN